MDCGEFVINATALHVALYGLSPFGLSQQLGITPTALEAIAPYYLQGRRHPHSGVQAVHGRH